MNEPSTLAGAPADGNRWSRFWFTPLPSSMLHRVRLLAGLLFCFWILTFAGQRAAFFSLDGWFDADAYLETNRPNNTAPVPIGWSIFYLAGSNRAAFDALYWCALAAVASFTLGIATRITGVLTWVAVVSFLANPASSFDADFLLGILAFYLMIGYALLGIWNGRLTPLEYVFGPHDTFVLAPWLQRRRTEPWNRPSYAANLVVRVLQVHFALIVVTSGLHKLQSGDWWAGAALWYPLHPPFQTTVEKLNQEKANAAFVLGVLSLVQYVALAWQIAFPLFAWRRGLWRVILLGGALAGWIGAVLMLGLPLFGPIYLIGCLSYVSADEWQRLHSWTHARLGRAETKSTRVAAETGKINVALK